MTVSFEDCPDVRLAVPEDFFGTMELMKIACSENGQYPINIEKVTAMLLRYYNKQGVLLVVIGEIGKPVAYVLSAIDTIWYSDSAHLFELSLFVHPDHRKSTYAKQLMSFSKKASDGLSLDLVIGVFHNQRTDSKIKLYRRQFGDQAGAYFLYRPNAN